jgi:hypothetical protein
MENRLCNFQNICHIDGRTCFFYIPHLIKKKKHASLNNINLCVKSTHAANIMKQSNNFPSNDNIKVENKICENVCFLSTMNKVTKMYDRCLGSLCVWTVFNYIWLLNAIFNQRRIFFKISLNLPPPLPIPYIEIKLDYDRKTKWVHETNVPHKC